MEIVFIVNDILGGVAYLNFDIINNLSLSEKPKIRVILTVNTHQKISRFRDTINADVIQRFEYSPFENAYHLHKRLAKLIGNAPGAIICNDGLELTTIWCEGTNKTVFNIVHDDYNFQLSKKFHPCIDVHLCHSRYFDEKVKTEIGGKSVFYRHGVIINKREQLSTITDRPKLCFIGRLVESKGVLMLKGINDELVKKNIKPIWKVIGSGPLREKLLRDWEYNDNITFHAPEKKEDVVRMIQGSDFFVFPSTFEGFGIALIEAASMGVIPIVRYIQGGFHEVSETLEAEIIYEESNIEMIYANKIIKYTESKDKGLEKKYTLSHRASTMYDIKKTANEFFEILLENQIKHKTEIVFKPKSNFRLDKKYLPNNVVKHIRKNLSYFKTVFKIKS